MRTKGGELLRTWLKEQRRSQVWFSIAIGEHQPSLSAWLNGREMPLRVAIKIRNATGIDVDAWTIEADGPEGASHGVLRRVS